MHYKLRNFQQASEYFQQATKLEPKYAEAHYHLGLAHLALASRDTCIEQYTILKALNAKLAADLYRAIYRDRVVRLSEVR